jgi:ABC-type uncharacterized transport system substrate-binding protein
MARALATLILTALIAFTSGIETAAAHPHVWIVFSSELVFASDGALTAVRHHWTFDKSYSEFALQNLDAHGPNGPTPVDLAPLAELNVQALKEFSYYTAAHAEGKALRFGEPRDSVMDYADGMLTLHFTLPLAAPRQAARFDVEIYDASYFVAFVLAQKNPAALAGEAAGCKVARITGNVARPPETASSESAAEDADAARKLGLQFKNRIEVVCS